MTNKNKPLAVYAHDGDVAHSAVFGATRTGMSLTPVIKELFKDLESGHPGVKISLAQAGSPEAEACRTAKLRSVLSPVRQAQIDRKTRSA